MMLLKFGRRRRGICDTSHNLTDEHLLALAANGGLIGVALIDVATCRNDLQATVASMRYIADLAGVEQIALGSGFNGAAPTPIDAGGWPKLTQALLDDGFSKDEIATIMGGNALRILQQVLPAN